MDLSREEASSVMGLVGRRGTAEAALARFRSTPDIPSDIWITANNHGHNVGADPLLPDEKAPITSVDEQFRANLEFAEQARCGARPDQSLPW